jgi:hypothetical protein
MSLPSLIVAAALAAAPAPDTGAPLSFANAEKLRCAATFAIVARGQASGDARTAGFMPLATRGEAYFIRAVAQVMDSTGLGEEAVTARLQALAAALASPGQLEAAMPSCLASLEASGL